MVDGPTALNDVGDGDDAARLAALTRRGAGTLALLGCALWPWIASGAETATVAGPACRAQTFAAVNYTVCTFDTAHADIRIFWRRADGAAYRTFGALAGDLSAQGLDLLFAANGGMFAGDFSPVGLFVAGGKLEHPVNTASVKPNGKQIPNFYRKPNGIFLMAGGHARVLTTDAYVKAHPPADYATQSGPMLVIDNAIHPDFIKGSTDMKRRSGVGIQDGTHVAFAIADTPVNFYDFARFFRDVLGCKNALYLDGGMAPGMFDRTGRRSDAPGDGGYGPIIGVVSKAAR